MKKIKLLMPILGISALSSALLPLVSCGCKTVDAISFSGETTKNVIVDKTCTGTVIFEGFKLGNNYELNNLKVEVTDVSKIASEKLELTILPNNDTEFKVQVVGSDLSKAGTTNFKLKFDDASSNWTQTLDKQFSIGFNADNEEKITDTGVTARTYTDLKADPAWTNNLLITGNYTTNRSIDGLKAEAIVETNTDVELTAEIVDPTPSNDDASFQVNIFASNITNDETINFDLIFTDTNNPLWTGFTSEDYSIGYKKDNTWDNDQYKNYDACIVDGNTTYFCLDLEESKICNSDFEDITTDVPSKQSYDRSAFDKPLYLNPNKTGLSAIPDYFLYDCPSFNQPLILPKSVTTIGNDCLHNYPNPDYTPIISFNKPIHFLNDLTSIGSHFIEGCNSFNQPLTLPNNMETISDDFMSGCSSFNHPLTLPKSLTSIGKNFLIKCTVFNQPLTLQDGLETIGDRFMDENSSFNQPLTLPNSLTSIGNSFMHACKAFDQTLTLPKNLKTIGDNFLYSCVNFNQPLALPNGLETIGSFFLLYNYKFNKPLTFPKSLTKIDYGFMYDCYNMTSQIDIQDLQVNVFGDETDDTFTLSSDKDDAAMYTKGIEIIGTHKQEFKGKFQSGALEDDDGNMYYRNLK